jgi:hypothetical protein
MFCREANSEVVQLHLNDTIELPVKQASANDVLQQPEKESFLQNLSVDK